MQDVEQKRSPSNKTAITCAAVSVAAAVGAGFAAGRGTGLEIPEGSVGLKDTPNKFETQRQVREIPPGFYWFGDLRFPNTRVVRLGEEQRQNFKATLTPGTIDKMKSGLQKSLVAHKLMGDRLKQTESQHLELEGRWSFKFPGGTEIDRFLDRIQSRGFERDVAAACGAALKKREDYLNRKFLKVDMDKVNAEVSAEVGKALGIDGFTFEVTKLERITLGDRDFAAERDATRKKVDGIGEVLFELGASLLLRK